MSDISKARLKRQAKQSRAQAVQALTELSKVYQLAATELEAGTLTRSPLELLTEAVELLKPLEQYRDDEALML